MHVIPPLVAGQYFSITDAMLVSSTVVDVAPAAWSNAITYTTGLQVSDRTVNKYAVYESLQDNNLNRNPATSPMWWKLVGYTYPQYSSGATFALNDYVLDSNAHRIYKSLIATNTGNALTDTTKWQDSGPSNRWAPFDLLRNTPAQGGSPMVYTINPGTRVDSLGLANLDADSYKVEVFIPQYKFSPAPLLANAISTQGPGLQDYVVVTQIAHGYAIGHTVNISGAVAFNGINPNGGRVIVAVTPDTWTYVQAGQTGAGAGGGTAIKVQNLTAWSGSATKYEYPPTTLQNAITTVSGSNEITIAHANNGYLVGQQVFISGCAAVGGITPAGMYQITSALPDSYKATPVAGGLVATSAATGGGNYISTTNQTYWIPARTDRPRYLTTTLIANPLQTLAVGSPNVQVFQYSHGFLVGQQVTISGATAFGGITPNGTVTVASVVDVNNWTFVWTANATSVAAGGGSAVVSQNLTIWNGTTDGSGSVLAWSSSTTLVARNTLTWSDYFFGDFKTKKTGFTGDIPPYSVSTIKITIYKASGLASVGSIWLNMAVWIGDVEESPNVTARNFSTIDRQFDGTAILVKRRSVPQTAQKLITDKAYTTSLMKLQDDLNAIPAYWVGLEDEDDEYFSPLVIVGIYTRFDLVPEHAWLRVELELEEM